MLSQYSWAQPSARRPPEARGGSVITEPRGARRPPARKHAAGPGTGKSGGEPQRSQPRHAPALEPPQAARLPPRLSQGPAVSSPPRTSHSESFAGPALGEAPASGPWGFRHHGTSRRQTPTSAQARRRARNGEERGRTPALATPPRSRSRAPTSRTASSLPQSGARGLVAPQNIPQRKLCGPSPRGRTPALTTPPRSRSRAPTSRTASSPPQSGACGLVAPRTSHSESFAGPALSEAPARGPWGFRHHGTLRRQTPTSAQACRRAGNGEERGRTPALATPPRSRSRPPRTSHRESFAGPALGEAPASGPWGFRHHGTSRRQTPTSAQARRRAGNGEERGRTPALATPPRSRSRAPTSRTASSPPQSGARGLVAPQNIPQRKLCGPSPRQGARPRPVGVPSSRNLEAPDAHQRASTPQGRERGRVGANPSARNPATLPL